MRWSVVLRRDRNNVSESQAGYRTEKCQRGHDKKLEAYFVAHAIKVSFLYFRGAKSFGNVILNCSPQAEFLLLGFLVIPFPFLGFILHLNNSFLPNARLTLELSLGRKLARRPRFRECGYAAQSTDDCARLAIELGRGAGFVGWNCLAVGLTSDGQAEGRRSTASVHSFQPNNLRNCSR